MTVALAIMYFFDHGVTRRDFRDLALELQRRGHHVLVFSARWKSEMLPGVRHVKVRADGRDTIAKLHSFSRNVRRASRGLDIDCLVAFSRMSGADFYYVGEHETSDEWKSRYGFFRFFMPGFLRERCLWKRLFSAHKSTKIWVLASEQQRFIEEKYGTPPERFEVFGPGVPADIRRLNAAEIAECRSCLREKFDIGAEEKIFVMSGSDFEGKGVDRAIQSFSYLADGDLRKVRLIVVGKGNVSKMDALARHCNVRDRVFFLEKTASDRLFSGADLVLAPMRRGVLDQVPLEALTCGVPVVVTGKYLFSRFVAENGGVVIDEPFHCRTLTRQLQHLLVSDNLDELRKKAEAFDPSGLYRRVIIMADRIEDFSV